MVALAQDPPLQGRPLAGGLALLAIGIGLAVKTPTVPFHTWLPPAHTDAPAVGSAILAGVLLKMGTYGFVRIALPMLPEAWRTWAVVAVVVGAVGVLYGALVALAQTDLKRMIAYTSVAHMGYVLLAVGAAGMLGGTDERGAHRRGHRRRHPDGQPRASSPPRCSCSPGVLQDRPRATTSTPTAGCSAPRRASPALFAVARLRQPRAARVLRLRRRVPGAGRLARRGAGRGGRRAARPAGHRRRCSCGRSAGCCSAQPGRLAGGSPTCGPRELAAVVPLLLLSLLLGVLPRPLLDVVEPSARVVVELVGR